MKKNGASPAKGALSKFTGGDEHKNLYIKPCFVWTTSIELFTSTILYHSPPCTKFSLNSLSPWFPQTLLLHIHSQIPCKCNTLSSRYRPILQCGRRTTTAASRSMLALYIRERLWIDRFHTLDLYIRWPQISNLTTSISLRLRGQVSNNAGRKPARRCIHTQTMSPWIVRFSPPWTAPLAAIREWPGTTPATTQE